MKAKPTAPYRINPWTLAGHMRAIASFNARLANALIDRRKKDAALWFAAGWRQQESLDAYLKEGDPWTP